MTSCGGSGREAVGESEVGGEAGAGGGGDARDGGDQRPPVRGHPDLRY